jgi:hypothetical protein
MVGGGVVAADEWSAHGGFCIRATLGRLNA